MRNWNSRSETLYRFCIFVEVIVVTCTSCILCERFSVTKWGLNVNSSLEMNLCIEALIMRLFFHYFSNIKLFIVYQTSQLEPCSTQKRNVFAPLQEISGFASYSK